MKSTIEGYANMNDAMFSDLEDRLPEPELTDIARTILERRYLIKNMDGEVIETPKEMFWRVAFHVARAEFNYGADVDQVLDLAVEFYKMMALGYWLPNSPTLANAGRPNGLGQLSACFVLPVTDCMSNGQDGIYDTLTNMALIHKSGGGTGFSFSRLRPSGSIVRSTTGVSSGPVSFMTLYDASTNVVSQGGMRRGANMGILRVDHPDILEFIDCKKDTSKVTNFNISVAITDDFMEAVEHGDTYQLVFNGKLYDTVEARDVWDKICQNAWASGEPGLFFIDEANRHNPVPHIGDYEATNPCWTGDTLVWTVDGPRRFDDLAETGDDVPVLTQTDDGGLTVKMMRRPHCNGVKEIVRVVLDDGTTLRCTATHGVYLRNGERVDAQDLKPGDSVASVYRYRANSKGYTRLSNGVESPLEHHVMVEWSEGRRPNYPDEHCHHKNSDKSDNRPENLEILPASLHNSMNMRGEDNPAYGLTGEDHPCHGIDWSGENNPRYRHDISTEDIRQMRESGMSQNAIAQEVGCSQYTVAKRLGWERPVNHKVVRVEHTGDHEPVYNGAVDDTERYFVMCGEKDAILSANCAEQCLLPYDVCNLGSLNLGKFVTGEGTVDSTNMEYYIGLSVRFLDNVIDMNEYPLPEIKERAESIRRIGNGVMGFADMLIKMGIPYGSEQSMRTADMVADFFVRECKRSSRALAMDRGVYPGALDGETQRNCNVTTVAPTGTISMIAGCSGGIEPLYAVVMKRNQAGVEMMDVNPLFADHVHELVDMLGHTKRPGSDLHDHSFQRVIDAVYEAGSLDKLDPKWMVDPEGVFKTSATVTPEQHIRMQAVWQEHICNAISKTINLPEEATLEDVKQAYELAYELKCKGVTVYRDGSRPGQVLSTGKTKGNNGSDGEDRTGVDTDVQEGGHDTPETGPARKYGGRPEVLHGTTRKVDSPIGAVYVTLNEDGAGNPYEAIVTTGKAGGTANSFGEAIGRLISLALRSGVDVTHVYRQLRGISSERTIGMGPNKILSGPDAIAYAIGKHMGWENGEVKVSSKALDFASCPECKSELHFSEGCYTCQQCGYSGCS